ncbi:S53 family peptidase [Streptomyces sp. NPDC001135]
MTLRKVPLHGSERAPSPGAERIEDVPDTQSIDLTLYLRRRTGLPKEYVDTLRTLTPEDLSDQYGADPDDVAQVRRVAERHGLRTETDLAGRRIFLSGTLGRLREVIDPGALEYASTADPRTGRPVRHRHRTGVLHIPAEWEGIVTGVLGFDDRPQARPHLRLHDRAHAGHSYTPPQLADVYRFPKDADGAGQSLAILELGGGFTQQDLDAYFTGLGITPTPTVRARGIHGARNAPEGDPDGPDGEVLLDIDVAGALAPRAQQTVYFAPNNDRAFADALITAVHATPTPTAVSISWGKSEDSWTDQNRNVFEQALADAAALGVTVCAATGDEGSGDGVHDGRPHADFPASSPLTLACGGTRLDADTHTGEITSEVVWHTNDAGTGGGFSDVFQRPAWQVNAVTGGNGQGRGIPDVSANADPASGYLVRVDGQPEVIGGTSAVAPLWAALVCRLAQGLGRPLGLLQPLVYQGVATHTPAPGFHDVTEGNNGSYKAEVGWDACTGLGTPDGRELLQRLRSVVGTSHP